MARRYREYLPGLFIFRKSTNLLRNLIDFRKSVMTDTKLKRNLNIQFVVRVIFWSLLFLSLILTVKRVYIDRDFVLSQEIECDPWTESCFTRLCEEDCDTEKEYYKLQTVSARYMSTCDPHIEECPEIDCNETPTCEIVFCDEITVTDGEWCTTPETYHGDQSEEGTDDLEEDNAINQ